MNLIPSVLSIIRCPNYSRQGPGCAARLQWFFLLWSSGQQRWSYSCYSTSEPGATTSQLQIHWCISWPIWPKDRIKSSISFGFFPLLLHSIINNIQGPWQAKMGYVQFFSHIHKTNLQPSKGCPLGVFRCSLTLPYTPPHMLSFLKSLNQNVTLRSIPFFWRRRCQLYSFQKWTEETWSCCMLWWIHKHGLRHMTAETALCLEAYCLYSALAFWDARTSMTVKQFCSHSLIHGNIQRSVLPLSYSSNPGYYQQCCIM